MFKNVKCYFLSALALAASACSSSDNTAKFTVTADAPDDGNGFYAYLMDYDTKECIDSVLISSGRAVFNGEIDAPRLVTLRFGNDRGPTFILEPADILVDSLGNATGSPFSERLDSIMNQIDRLAQTTRPDSIDENDFAQAQALRANEILENGISQNSDNPVGLYLFLQLAYDLPLEQFDEALAKYPYFKNSKRVMDYREAAACRANSGPGSKFIDFEIVQPDSSVAKLSDYVGKGNWMLVDFWASWCGPCVRETAVLKDLLNKYSDKGLGVVGVAVWDEVEATQDAVNRLQLPWPQILDAGTVPTDLYGISGIPCILLVSPDGTIVARDLQDDMLRAAVAEALDNNN